MKILLLPLILALSLICTMFCENVLAESSDPTVSNPSSGTNPSAESNPSSHSSSIPTPSKQTPASSSQPVPPLTCPTGQVVTALDQCPNNNPSLSIGSSINGLGGSHLPQELASTSHNLTKSVIDCFTKDIHINQLYKSTEMVHRLISCFVEVKHSKFQ